MKTPTRKYIKPGTGETYELNYNWVNMEGKSRKHIIEDIKQALNDMYTLEFEKIDDLFYQLQQITMSNSGDQEKEDLRYIVDRARNELSNVKKRKTVKDKNDIMRIVLSDIEIELETHLRNHFK